MTKTETDQIYQHRGTPRGLTVPTEEVIGPRRRRKYQTRMSRTHEGTPKVLRVRGDEVDMPLEGSTVELEVGDFELFEDLLIQNIGFPAVDARRYVENYEIAYYEGNPIQQKFVIDAISGAFAAFRPPGEEKIE